MDKNVPADQQTIRFKVFPKSERVNEYSAEIAKLNAKGPRLVHDMTLNYEYICIYPNLMQSKNLPRPLEKLKLIKALYLYFSESEVKDDMILQKISQNIKSLSSLKTLKLQFPYARWISLKGVEHLASALAQMKLLEKLIMNFNYAEWANDESLHLLFKGLKKYKNLQSFHLDIPHCMNITEKSFKSLASTFKHSLQSLKELSLDFAGLNLIEGNGLDFLASGLTNLAGLQTFRINFSQLQVSSIDIYSSFMSSIRHLKSLRVLVLNFSCLPVNASTLKHLAMSFKSLTRLHTLSLSFADCSTFTFQEMEVLAQCLHSLASSLKNLTLSFRCYYITDRALEKLSGGLEALTNLSEINLQCDSCPFVGDDGVERVTYELGGLPNLHSVTLDFRSCRSIKDAYYNGLKMNKNIKNLTFYYARQKV